MCFSILCLVNHIDATKNISATTYRSPFTVLRTAPVDRGIFPRPKNVPPARFLNGLSNPPFFIKKKNPSKRMGFSFWRSRRDLNPRYPFGVHTISSRARYDHFDTAPCGVVSRLTYDTPYFSICQAVNHFFSHKKKSDRSLCLLTGQPPWGLAFIGVLI